MDQGQTLLSEEKYEEVLKIAETLEQEHYSGAFDLAAQAYAAQGKILDAIGVLERGVSLAPEAWLNWQLLGNYRSDIGKYDEAAAAYERALGCERVWVDSVRLNQAVLANRQGQIEVALRYIELVEDPELSLRKVGMKSRLLLDSGNPEATLELCDLAPHPERPTAAERTSLAGMCVTRAKALISLGQSPLEVGEDLIRNAVASYPESDELLTFLRELRNESSDQAQHFKVLVSYGLDPVAQAEHGAVGFVRSALVAADTPEEALSILREVEANTLLVLDNEPEIERTKRRSDSPLKGIISLSRRHFFSR